MSDRSRLNITDEVLFGGLAVGATLAACTVALWMAGWSNEHLGVELASSVVAATMSGALGTVLGRGQMQMSRAGLVCLHVILFWLEGTLLSRMVPRRIHIATFCASAMRMLVLIAVPSFTLQRPSTARRAERKDHDS